MPNSVLFRRFLPLTALVALLVPLVGWSSAATAKADGSAFKGGVAQLSTPKSTTFTPTGYFYVAKSHGRWTLVTPQGDPYYASGIDNVSPDGSGTDQVTGQCPYCDTVAADFPSTAAWGSSTIAQLRSWGFNTLGAYSDNADLGSQMPYEVQLSMASGDDWFAPSFVTNADEVAATQVAPLADDPNVIGYFTDSELDWGPLLGSGSGTFETALTQYLQLPAGSPGLAEAQQYVGNPSGFLYALATRYFSVTTAAIRMYDTNHLILGVKAEGQEIEPALLRAAIPYVNVFSIEDYQLWPGYAQGVQNFWPAYLTVEQNLADFEKSFKGPLMIGEYSFIAYGPETPDIHPGIYAAASNQQARADEYEQFMAPLYEDTPSLVGDDWFQYVDEPVNGRVGDGEDNNFGMVDVNGNPYPDINAAVQMMHSVVADEYSDAGPVCDSWAASGTGVTCTANMPTPSDDPLTIVTTTLPTGTVGTSYYFGGVYAAGGVPGYQYKLTQGSLPSGLKFDTKTGIITGTTKLAGTYSFTVQATDSGGSPPVSQALSITVNPPNVSIATKHLPKGKEGQSYSATFAAAGGTPPYTWAVLSGTIPPGLTLNPDGSVTGVPTAAGTFDFTAEVTDSSNDPESDFGSFAITIAPTG